jgi:hypothetical protein
LGEQFLWECYISTQAGYRRRLETSGDVVAMSQPKPFNKVFDQAHIDLLEKVMVRAWGVVSQVDKVPDTADNRRLLASCVIDTVMAGEDNYIKLVKRAVLCFRAKRTRHATESRKQSA